MVVCRFSAVCRRSYGICVRVFRSSACAVFMRIRGLFRRLFIPARGLVMTAPTNLQGVGHLDCG